MMVQRVIILLLCAMCINNAVLIVNNAQVWTPTLLAYSCLTKQNTSCSEKIMDYGLLGVGQNISTQKERVCLSNSPIGLVWLSPQEFNTNNTISIFLEAKIVKHDLVLWYNVTV